MSLITIFTPTYNRATKLHRLYETLIKEKNKNFEWLVIDDGSTDNTEAIINNYINENIINIRYIKKVNGGKQSCWNSALNLAKGNYFIGIDSDDTILENSMENIFKYLKKIEKNENVIGLRMGNIPMSIQNRKDKIEKEGFFSWRDEVFIWRNLSEKIDVYKTEIIKKYPYPIKKYIKFIPEMWLYSRLAKDNFKFYYTKESLGKYWDIEFENDGDRLTLSSHKKHSKGHIIARREVLNNDFDLFFKNPIYHLKNILRYIECCKIENESVYKDVGRLQKIFVTLFYIFGYFLSLKKDKDRSGV